MDDMQWLIQGYNKDKPNFTGGYYDLIKTLKKHECNLNLIPNHRRTKDKLEEYLRKNRQFIVVHKTQFASLCDPYFTSLLWIDAGNGQFKLLKAVVDNQNFHTIDREGRLKLEQYFYNTLFKKTPQRDFNPWISLRALEKYQLFSPLIELNDIEHIFCSIYGFLSSDKKDFIKQHLSALDEILRK